MTSASSPPLPRAVLFDATGTLIAPRESVGAVYSREAAAQGVEISAWRLDDAFRRIWSQGVDLIADDRRHQPRHEREVWCGVVRRTFLAADSDRRLPDPDGAFERLYACFASADAWQLLPGARVALSQLQSRGYRLGVVSNFDARLPGILEGLGVLPFFDAVVLAGEVGVAKPAAAIFARALERIAVNAQEAVFIGDDAEKDLAGARGAGLRALDVGALATLDALPDRVDAAFRTPEEPA